MSELPPISDARDAQGTQLPWMEFLAAKRRLSGVARLDSVARRYAHDRTASWHVLRERSFRTYILGSTVSNLGTWLQNTAQMLLAYQLTHSVLDVAAVTSAQFSGFLTIGPWAGTLAERMGRKRVLIGAQLVSAAVTGTLAVLEHYGSLTEMDLIIGAFGTGLALTFALPVQTAMLSALVPEHDKRAALAMNSVSYNAGRTLAPILCLIVLASMGTDWIFALNSISFIVFAAVVAAVYPRVAIADQKHVRAREILSIALKRPRIMLLLTMVAAVTFADDPILVLGPSVAHHLGISSSWPAYFLAALGIGTVLGALFPARPVTTRMAAFPLCALGLSVLIFAIGPVAWISLLGAIVAGVAGLLTGSAAQALLLKRATRVHAVHVMALWAVAWAGTKPIASLLDGVLASHLGVHWAAAVMAFPAISIAITEICLGPQLKAWLKNWMSGLNGTRQLAPQSVT